MANADQNPEIQRVVAIGAPAVPYLVQRLQNRSSWLTRTDFYRRAWSATPGFVQGYLRPPAADSSGEEQWISALAFTLGQIGPAAEPAVPALIEIANEKRLRWSTRSYTVQALGQIGPAASNAVPALVGCLKDNRQQLRREYIRMGVGAEHGDAADLSLRGNTALALARIGMPEARAIPGLKLLLGSTNRSARIRATVALWRMDPCPSNVDLVAGLLQSADPEIRRWTAVDLGNVGAAAACFAPTLESMLESMTGETNGIRSAVESALGRIRRESSEKP